MKIMSIAVMRWNSDTEDAILLDGSFNLSEYSFFQRGSLKEFMIFASKTVMKRIGAGVQAVDYEGNMVYTMVQSDGLGVVVMTDKEYPARVAVTMAKELIAQFKTVHGAVWRSTKADFACRFPRLDEAMQEYQDPTKVDKIMKVDKQLAETKDILYKTIDKVLERGEKLDELVDKSNTLSQQSKMFYKHAKKTNSCCEIM